MATPLKGTEPPPLLQLKEKSIAVLHFEKSQYTTIVEFLIISYLLHLCISFHFLPVRNCLARSIDKISYFKITRLALKARCMFRTTDTGISVRKYRLYLYFVLQVPIFLAF